MESNFSIETADVPKALRRFSGLIGQDTLKKRIERIEKTKEQMPQLGAYLSEMAATEYWIVEMLSRMRVRRHLALDLSERITHSTMSFVATILRVHATLDQAGKNELVGRLRGSMNDEIGFRPLVHEMAVIVYLSNAGWRISLPDLAGKGSFDILAERDGLAFEVECKTVRADAGNRIHRRDFRRLCDFCGPALMEASAQTDRATLIQLDLQENLPTKQVALQEVARAVEEVLENVPSRLSRSGFSLTVERLSAPGSKLKDETTVRSLLSYRYPEPDYDAFLAARGAGACVLVAKSLSPNRTLKNLYRLMRRAHKQFSGQRAAALWVNVENVEPHQWELLRSGSGLQAMSSRYLSTEKRPNVCFVAYSSVGTVHQAGSVTQEFGTVLCYENSDSPYYHESFGKMRL